MLYYQLITGEWRSLVARLVRDEEVGGSNPLSPTRLHSGSESGTISLSYFYAMYSEVKAAMSDESELQRIPSVSAIVQDSRVQTAAGNMSSEYLVDIARRCQAEVRAELIENKDIEPSTVFDRVLDEISILLRAVRTPTINGTGVIIHTNLGRSPVSKATAEAMGHAAANYLPLEVDPSTARRGGRGQEVELLLRVLTGAERTLVVNNNAAAVTLTLAALAAGKQVIVSRGEAVEIGGGFRIPDVIRQSGADLVEVGTTNRTYARDYAEAVNDQTAAMLKVHHSNFEISGFTAQPSVAEIAETAQHQGVLSIEDVGSGCLIDTRKFGLSFEPTLSESIDAGVDVVTASGDKLLGGPQAGLILGKKEIVDCIARHPLARAMRVDKTTLAGIAATLRHYLYSDATEQIPVWWCISRDVDWLISRTTAWKEDLAHPAISTIETQAVIGGGSLPGRSLRSSALSIDTGSFPTDKLARLLRTSTPSVFPRVEENSVLIDGRTVLPDQDEQLLLAIRNVLKQMQSAS